MSTRASLWSAALLPVGVLAVAFLTASLDALLAAHTAGRRRAAELAAPLRETARLLVTQRRTTIAPDALLWRLGGAAVLVLAVLAAVVVPLGERPAVDLRVGVVWFNAMEALLWAGVWAAGWGANSAYSLVGGYRFLAQALAYELPFMFCLITAALAAGSLRVTDIAAGQAGLWYVVWMPVAFAVYLLSVASFAFWGPMAEPVARALAGGVTAELSGVDRLVFLAGRYALLAVGAAFAVPLFLGGGHGPLLPAELWVAVKTLAVLALLVAARWRLPAVRMDRYEEIAWTVLVPVTIAQTLVVAIVVLARS